MTIVLNPCPVEIALFCMFWAGAGLFSSYLLKYLSYVKGIQLKYVLLFTIFGLAGIIVALIFILIDKLSNAFDIIVFRANHARENKL